jgi:hypothetical protein
MVEREHRVVEQDLKKRELVADKDFREIYQPDDGVPSIDDRIALQDAGMQYGYRRKDHNHIPHPNLGRHSLLIVAGFHLQLPTLEL